MDYNRRQNYVGDQYKQDPDVNYDGRQFFRSLSPLGTSSEQHLIELNLEYDEVDLLSECSTPVSYVPGRYLQLCDISPVMDIDTNLWPVSNGSSMTDVDMTSLLPGTARHVDKEGHLYPQTFRKTPGMRQNSKNLVITVAVCMVVALSALGGLATFV